MNTDSIQSGTVKFFNKSKFFGFIIDDGTKKDIFFHGSQLPDRYEPQENDRVLFYLQDGKNFGPQAVNIHPE